MYIYLDLALHLTWYSQMTFYSQSCHDSDDLIQSVMCYIWLDTDRSTRDMTVCDTDNTADLHVNVLRVDLYHRLSCVWHDIGTDNSADDLEVCIYIYAYIHMYRCKTHAYIWHETNLHVIWWSYMYLCILLIYMDTHIHINVYMRIYISSSRSSTLLCVSWSVAVCCSVLQCVAVCCSVLQSVCIM